MLLLDEPTVGVDPQSRNAIFDNLEALRAAGKGLLYTTHYMEEAERLCDRIVVIDQGRVVAHDTLRGLYRLLPASNRLVVELERPREDGPWLDGLRATRGRRRRSRSRGDALAVGLADLTEAAPRVLGWLAGTATRTSTSAASAATWRPSSWRSPGRRCATRERPVGDRAQGPAALPHATAAPC